jgi:hypothetical protein
MKTQNYHTQDGAIHYGYAHKASLALIDLIAEANKRLDSQVTPDGASGIAEVYKTINGAVLGGEKEGKMSRYSDINRESELIPPLRRSVRYCGLTVDGRVIRLFHAYV